MGLNPTTFTFTGRLFETAAGDNGAWVFVALPARDSDEILEIAPARRGFGSVRVTAIIGSSEWNTSLFPSKELGTYILPVKRQIRLQQGVDTGDTVQVSLRLMNE